MPNLLGVPDLRKFCRGILKDVGSYPGFHSMEQMDRLLDAMDLAALYNADGNAPIVEPWDNTPKATAHLKKTLVDRLCPLYHAAASESSGEEREERREAVQERLDEHRTLDRLIKQGLLSIPKWLANKENDVGFDKATRTQLPLVAWRQAQRTAETYGKHGITLPEYNRHFAFGDTPDLRLWLTGADKKRLACDWAWNRSENRVNAYTVPAIVQRAATTRNAVSSVFHSPSDRAYAALWTRPASHHVPAWKNRCYSCEGIVVHPLHCEGMYLVVFMG